MLAEDAGFDGGLALRGVASASASLEAGLDPALCVSAPAGSSLCIGDAVVSMVASSTAFCGREDSLSATGLLTAGFAALSGPVLVATAEAGRDAGPLGALAGFAPVVAGTA